MNHLRWDFNPPNLLTNVINLNYVIGVDKLFGGQGLSRRSWSWPIITWHMNNQIKLSMCHMIIGWDHNDVVILKNLIICRVVVIN